MADDDNRKRAMPEPVAHAMIIADFPIFKSKTDYLELVKYSLDKMKAEAVDEKEGARIANALDLCTFFMYGVHNSHNTRGIEEIKQLFIQEASATKEAISKGGVVKDMGGVDPGPTV